MSIELLRKACEHYGSQRKVGEMLGKSATTVNLLLKGKYPNPEYLCEQAKITFAHLTDIKIECPILGMIHSEVCSRYKKMARDGIVKTDRLYMQVRIYCGKCILNRGE